MAAIRVTVESSGPELRVTIRRSGTWLLGVPWWALWGYGVLSLLGLIPKSAEDVLVLIPWVVIAVATSLFLLLMGWRFFSKGLEEAQISVSPSTVTVVRTIFGWSKTVSVPVTAVDEVRLNRRRGEFDVIEMRVGRRSFKFGVYLNRDEASNIIAELRRRLPLRT